MSEDEIIARAQRDVIARRASRLSSRWNGSSAWIFPILALTVIISFLLAPEELPRKLFLIMGGVCGLRSSHSYFAGDRQLPLEARMMGIYGGFMLTFMVLAIYGRLHARHLGQRLTIILLVLLFGVMVFDGVNSTLFEIGQPFLYRPTNPLRLFTGLASGITLASGLAWLWGLIVAPRRDTPPRAVVESIGELVLLIMLNIGFGLLVVAQYALLYYPIALLGVAGMVSTMMIAALLIILRLSRLEGQIASYHYLIPPGSLAFLCTCAVLAATAMARWSTT